ncbi:Transmembrane protein 126 [Cinara cedri]|uniref:Transmembrane protein 126 n=1 Tax=Cinara cedri TaxID=506608 RepID=A0A5E4MDA2_9HEMI|nr:Transmembrane protein 126 [Cinara cedri]
MFIERATDKEIPKGAIRLTSEEVYEYMIDLIHKWPSSTEIWALKHGNPILACAVVVSSSVILNFYRRQLKLKNYGRFTLFLPVVLTPSILNQMYQTTKTTKSILLQKDCSTCITTQSMFIQLGTGIIYPMLGAIAGTYMFGTKMNTFILSSNGPAIINEFALHLMKTSRPLYNRLTGFVIGHVLLSFAISYYQMENLDFLRFKMMQQQNEDIENLKQSKRINKLPHSN